MPSTAITVLMQGSMFAEKFGEIRVCQSQDTGICFAIGPAICIVGCLSEFWDPAKSMIELLQPFLPVSWL